MNDRIEAPAPPMPPGDLFVAAPSAVSIYEVGPRDGLQNEKQILPTDRKVELVEGLIDAGLRRVEITSFVNPRWIPAMADHMEVASRIKPREGVRLSALVPNMRGLDGATRAGMQEVAVFMAASQTHNHKNINKSTEEALRTYRGVVGEALSRGMKVRGYISCVYGCPYEGAVPLDDVLMVCHELLDMGVYELSLGDTIGVGTPRQIEYVFRGLMRSGISLPQVAVHFHDTRGTALANITVALQFGIGTIDSAVGGLGGCPYAPGASGNVATEDVVYMLQGMGVETGVDLDRLVAISARLGGQLARELPSKYLKAHLGHCARLGQPVY
ncbi:hydroxymethylglutaryl-CoA lyase [Paraliomyxa miuraensis]|uniref:hydroxymethylglutaryl-CoA lyase n=1 Tax=Paraliomyxa miuraensis TaxID=376150 RepID=UPI002B1CDCD3|nr:hydroxymethylglutaryl-CoA lyase [Paraliomyxa miuraensis]